MREPIRIGDALNVNAGRTLSAKLAEAAWHTAVYGLGSALQALLGFILIPLYTRYYTPDTYGALAILTLSATLAGTVFYLGASSSLSRSYFDHEDLTGRRLAVSTALWMTLAGAGTQIALGWCLRRELSLLLLGSPDYGPHVACSQATSALTFTGGLLLVVLRFERKSKQVILLNLLGLVVMSGLTVFFLVRLDLGLMAPILGGLLTQIVLLVPLGYAARGLLSFRLSWRELRSQLSFGLPQVLAGLGYYSLSSADRFFISRFDSMSGVGVYSIGYKLGTVIHVLLIIPFAQIWAPMRMEYRADENATELNRLVLTYYFMLGILCTVGVSAFAPELLRLVGGKPEYALADRVCPWIMIGHLFYGAVNIVDIGIYLARKALYYAYAFAVVLALNLALNWAIVPHYGYMGAAYVATVSYVTLSCVVFIASRRLYPVHVEARRLLMLLASGGFTLALCHLLTQAHAVVAVIGKGLLISALAALWHRFALTERERQRISGLALDALGTR
jgi:O-antigen/teichoic acid export membrane protein